MSKELIKHDKIFDYTSIWIDNLRGGETQIVNTNKLLKSYNGITGLKTGTTGDAGSCISATAERSGMKLIAVVLGADTGTNRFKDAATLLDYGFANYETSDLKGELKSNNIKVNKGMVDSVGIECSDIGTIVVQKGEKQSISVEENLEESIEAPFKKGTKVGALTFKLGDKVVDKKDIVTTEGVDKISFSSILSILMSSLLKL